MNTMRNTLRPSLATLMLLAVGCGNPETGIPTRHIQGIVTLPPLGLVESEPADEDLIVSDEQRNDSLQTADGPFTIGYAYHAIRATSYDTCSEVEDDATYDTLCGIFSDEDWFRVRADYQGPIVFKARPLLTEQQEEDGVDADVDLQIILKDGTVVFTDGNSPEPLLDDDGEPILDDEGNARTFIGDPRYSTQVLAGDEFFIRATVNADEDDIAYEVVIVGNDPREHFIEAGIEGDTATFDLPEAIERPRQAAHPVNVGAYLSGDVENLGQPVGGTSCETWTYDEESETFWCAFDMVFLHQVTLEEAAVLDGMADGLDNECNGTADSGTEDQDEDGDGYTIADGDCNDHDVEVHPEQGDRWGDRKDNDCDGWADNGPDDVDDDGDGYCENGRDANGDGVCRGPAEVGGFAGGDCNDTNPNVHPGIGFEIPANGLDDDCLDGDSGLPLTNSDFNEDLPNPDTATDLEEIACGTNPNDPTDQPVDDDGDGLCDSSCLGTVDCQQDWDGDGFHNWLEVQCAMDPESVDTELPDYDGDGECDGMDSDADGDGSEKKVGNQGDDCNDLDPTIYPHPEDPETGEVIDSRYNYDVVDGIDNDCDGSVDENREWIRDGDGYAVNVDLVELDNDGDGFTLAERDCDDSDTENAPLMYFGNWEIRSANVVHTDFSLVHLFAGEFSSLNSTIAAPGERTATQTVPYDLDKGRVVWEVVEDWDDNEPPVLRPTADDLPRLDVWWAKQPEVGFLWFEATDNSGAELYDDVDSSGFSVPAPPWDEGTYQDLGDAAAAGKTSELSGTASEVVTDTWDGDNDGYRITFPEGGTVEVVLDWNGSKDLDAVAYCYFFNAINPPNYYTGIFADPDVAGGGLADVSKPEKARTVVPLPPGADCWFFIVQYSGAAGPYTFSVTVLEE